MLFEKRYSPPGNHIGASTAVTDCTEASLHCGKKTNIKTSPNWDNNILLEGPTFSEM